MLAHATKRDPDDVTVCCRSRRKYYEHLGTSDPSLRNVGTQRRTEHRHVLDVSWQWALECDVPHGTVQSIADESIVSSSITDERHHHVFHATSVLATRTTTLLPGQQTAASQAQPPAWQTVREKETAPH